MPYYDFFCRGCNILVEDEFFKIADEKLVKCDQCGKQMGQVILKAPGLRDPGGTGQKWTNDGYQMPDEKSGNLRTIKEKWEKGKNIIRDDVHKDDPGHHKYAQTLPKVPSDFAPETLRGKPIELKRSYNKGRNAVEFRQTHNYK